jgi:hypothetical protein
MTRQACSKRTGRSRNSCGTAPNRVSRRRYCREEDLKILVEAAARPETNKLYRTVWQMVQRN